MSKRRIFLSTAIGIIVMVGMYFLLLPQVANYESALDELRSIDAIWLLALVIACLANIGLYPLTVTVAVHGLGYWRGFIERQAGFLISNIIPGGGAVAVGTQVAILNHFRVRPARSAAAVGADAAFTYLITMGLPALAVALLVLDNDNLAGIGTIAILGILAFVISLVGLILIIRSDAGAQRIGRLGERLIGPIMRKLRKPVPDLQGALLNFRGDVYDLMAERWKALAITNVVAQITPFIVLLCALGGLGAFPDKIGIIQVFAAFSVAILLVSFPITPGGLGTVDAALIALLVAFGVDNSTAVAADLLWRLVWFLPQLIVGGVSMLIFVVMRARRRHHDDSNAELIG